MPKVTLQDIDSGYQSTTLINENNDTIEQAFDNTLSRDGSSPNAMGADIDMNSHKIINLAPPQNANDAARWQDVLDNVAVLGVVLPSQTGNAGRVLGTDGSTLGWYNYQNSLSGVLSADAVVVPCDSAGVVLSYAPAQGTFTLFSGATPVNPANISFTIGANPQGLVATINSSGQYQVTGGLDANEPYGEITFIATHAGASVSKKFTIGKAIQGLTGPPGSGADVFQGYLTRTSYSILCGQNGEPLPNAFDGAEGECRVFESGTEVTSAATFSVVATGCTGTINTAANTPVSGKPRGYYRVTAMSADVGTLAITATYNGRNFYATYTVMKSRVGYEIVNSLPNSGNYEGRVVFLTTDDKLYRYTGSAWTAAVPAVDISGLISATQIDNIGAAQVTGQLTDAQLQSIAAAKVSGQLTDAQLQSISAAKVTGQLTDSQLQSIAAAKVSGQLTAAQIASINAAQITGELTNSQIESIAAAKISGQLTASQIASIGAAQITGQITSTQIADNAITTPKLAAGAVTAAEIAANTITAGNIAAGAITTPKLAAGAVTSNEIAAGTIVAENIASGAITTPKIAAGAVTSNEIAASTITAGNIASGAITTPKLAAGAVTSNEIAAGTIVADNIASNAITTPKIEAGAVTTAKIAAGAIDADKIAANAVTTPKLDAGSVTTAKIAADAIVADKIAANAVTTPKLDAGAVTTAKIAAGAVTTDRLFVTGRGAALNDDPSVSDGSAWALPNSSIVSVSDGIVGTTAVRSSSNGYVTSRTFAFDPGKTYRVRCRARNVGGNGTFYLLVNLLDSSNTIIQGDGTYWYYPVSGVVPPSGWTEYTGTFGFGTARTFPSNARTMGCGVILNYDGTAGYMEAQDIRIEEALPASLIVDGAIVASKIATDAVTANKILAGAVTTDKIEAGAITTAKLAAGAVTTATIAAGAVTANEIAAGTITGDRIQSGAIDASRIAAGTITSDRIAPGTIAGDRIAAGTITGDLIAGNTITGDKIQAGSINADRIAAGTITADRIQANTITADNLANGAISSSDSNSATGTFTNSGYTTIGTVTYTPASANSKLLILVSGTVIIGDAAPTNTYAQVLLARDGNTLRGPLIVSRSRGIPVPFAFHAVVSVPDTQARVYAVRYNASQSAGGGDPHSVENSTITILELKK
jgi:hypothetical protein